MLVVRVFRASQEEKTNNVVDSQVVQYEPAHKGSINTVTCLSPDLCVSGGSDQVSQSVAYLPLNYDFFIHSRTHGGNIMCVCVCVCL